MTTIINNIEKIIKREKTTPERKIKAESSKSKSSNEILSELFSVFNADPPKIEEDSVKKSKKSKKKHKKEKKKRSRSSSTSDSDDSDYSHKRKKRKKSKSKRRKDSERTPPRSPIAGSPPFPAHLGFRKGSDPLSPPYPPPSQVPLPAAPSVLPKTPRIKPDPDLVKKERSERKEVKIKHEKLDIKTEHKHVPVKYEDSGTPPGSATEDSQLYEPDYSSLDKDLNLDTTDLRHKLENRKNDAGDSDKNKGKIQIKNLKFSAVFEETVKKAEEEARKKAKKYEDGECSDSSSDSGKVGVDNAQFPKTSDPGGILKMQADEEKLIDDEVRVKDSKSSRSTHKSSRRDRDSRKRSSRSRSRTRHHHRSSPKRKRSRSPRHRSRSKRSRSRRRSSRSRDRHRDTHRGRRSRSRESGVRLADSEKKRLLEVARRNAINMLKNGAVPAGAAALPPHTRNQVMAAIHSGGKSVDELTEYCKSLSKKEALGELSSVSSDGGMSENEDTLAFHHPFLVKEKAPIVMNIRGAAPLPIKSSTLALVNRDELRLQFPVSSGTQHRDNADWVPVEPKKDMQVAKISTSSASKSSTSTSSAKQLALPPTESSSAVSRPAPLALPPPPPAPVSPPPYPQPFSTGSQMAALTARPAPPALPALPAPGPQAYPPGISEKMDLVASIVSEKLSKIRREQEKDEVVTTRGFGWSKDNKLGQFTGSTDAHILTPRELASGTQAWAKKDQLVRAAPVEGGMGMHLLQKMGWTPGRGLGKEGTGALQPLLLEVKLDTRGLQAKEETVGRHGRGMKARAAGGAGRRVAAAAGSSGAATAAGKHPVSLLGEYCSKQKLGPPEYNLCFECGPDHKKNFLFKVKVAGTEYQPAVASANKKQAKADAAQLALQKLGIVI